MRLVLQFWWGKVETGLNGFYSVLYFWGDQVRLEDNTELGRLQEADKVEKLLHSFPSLPNLLPGPAGEQISKGPTKEANKIATSPAWVTGLFTSGN